MKQLERERTEKEGKERKERWRAERAVVGKIHIK